MVNSRQKGARVERALVKLLQEQGLAAEKISRTGYRGPDLTIPLLGKDRPVEVKARANGFGRLYDWIDGVEFLIVKADRREPLLVMRLKDAADYASALEVAKGYPTLRNALCDLELPEND